MRFKGVRNVDLALAFWLMSSAYMWRHNEAQFLVTTLVGAIVALVSPFEVGRYPIVRHLDTAAGLALAGAALVLPHLSLVTAVHNVVVGLAIAAASLVEPHEVRHAGPAHAATS